jgi:hypothetical protein
MTGSGGLGSDEPIFRNGVSATNGNDFYDGNESPAGFATNGPSERLKAASHFSRAPWNFLFSSCASALSSIDDFKIQSVTLDEPLMKNGKEVGWIKFSIDSWWISDEVADIKMKERENPISSPW